MSKDSESTQSVKKNKLPLPAVLAIGCFVILVLSLAAFGIVFAVAGKFIFSSFGQGFLKNTVEQTTGIKIENGKNGESFSVTDQKTGESIKLGEQKIPANFPKDFPLYPQAVPGGSAVGSEQTTGKGLWLLLESTDSLDKVKAFYDEQLEGKGWTVESTMNLGEGNTYKVKKEKLVGNVIISWSKNDAKTTILITLEPTDEKNPAPEEVGDDTSVIPEQLP